MSEFDYADVDMFHNVGLYIPTRTIIIGKDADDDGDYTVDGNMAMQVFKNTMILEQDEGPITYILHTNGGDDYSMWSIYDTIKACKNHTIIKVIGAAHSAGILILQAGKERIMSPNSRCMMHYDVADKTPKNEKSILDSMYENVLWDIIHKKRPDFKRSVLVRWLNTDTYLSPNEAYAIGLIDKIGV